MNYVAGATHKRQSWSVPELDSAVYCWFPGRHCYNVYVLDQVQEYWHGEYTIFLKNSADCLVQKCRFESIVMKAIGGLVKSAFGIL